MAEERRTSPSDLESPGQPTVQVIDGNEEYNVIEYERALEEITSMEDEVWSHVMVDEDELIEAQRMAEEDWNNGIGSEKNEFVFDVMPSTNTDQNYQINSLSQ